MTKEKETAEPSQAPTQAQINQMVSKMKEQLKMVGLQEELQRLNTSIAQHRVLEIEALIKIEDYKGPKGNQPAGELDPNLVEHTVTQNDLDTIPEFTAQGFTLGMKVGIPKEVYAALYPQKTEAQAQAMAVVED